MPESVHSQDQDQSMMDAAPQEQEQEVAQDDYLELEDKRVVVVCAIHNPMLLTRELTGGWVD